MGIDSDWFHGLFEFYGDILFAKEMQQECQGGTFGINIGFRLSQSGLELQLHWFPQRYRLDAAVCILSHVLVSWGFKPLAKASGMFMALLGSIIPHVDVNDSPTAPGVVIPLAGCASRLVVGCSDKWIATMKRRVPLASVEAYSKQCGYTAKINSTYSAPCGPGDAMIGHFSGLVHSAVSAGGAFTAFRGVPNLKGRATISIYAHKALDRAQPANILGRPAPGAVEEKRFKQWFQHAKRIDLARALAALDVEKGARASAPCVAKAASDIVRNRDRKVRDLYIELHRSEDDAIATFHAQLAAMAWPTWLAPLTNAAIYSGWY